MSMTSLLVTLLVVVTLCVVPSKQCEVTRLVGIIPVKNVGLMNVFNHDTNNVLQKHSVLCSTYDTARSSFDPVIVLQHPGEALSNNFEGYEGKTMYSEFYWPKEVRQIPRGVFGFDAIGTPDGSTIFGKDTGAIYVTNAANFQFPMNTTDIASTVIPSSWMYSNLIWKRVDRDLFDDVMACRVQIESGLVRLAQLVWLEQPRDGIEGRNWRITVLKDSACDTAVAEAFIRLGIFDTYEVLYATGIYTQRLTFFYTTGALNNWDNPNNVAAAIIESGREYYDVWTDDINNDGRVDVLVTVQAQNEGSVEVFEYPENDFRNADGYIRHVLYGQFTSRNGGTAGRTPGIARTFYPTSVKARKPWIYVSGGDDGRAYYLRPKSETPSNWNYELVTVMDAGPSQTISGMTSADINGDGFEELFVSVRNRDLVQVHTFNSDP